METPDVLTILIIIFIFVMLHLVVRAEAPRRVSNKR